MAEHIEQSEKGRGKKVAERIAWATVNKKDGGAAGTGKKKTSEKSTKKAGRKTSKKSTPQRSTRKATGSRKRATSTTRKKR